MVYVTSYYLITVIERELKSTIELYRQSKRTYYFDGDYFVADQEVNDFIFSIPYFTYDLKEFLYSRDSSIVIEETQDWLYKFLENIYLWSESAEWLYDDMPFIRDPSLSNEFDEARLDLATHNKAIV